MTMIHSVLLCDDTRLFFVQRSFESQTHAIIREISLMFITTVITPRFCSRVYFEVSFLLPLHIPYARWRISPSSLKSVSE